jgi:hypothetical protein
VATAVHSDTNNAIQCTFDQRPNDPGQKQCTKYGIECHLGHSQRAESRLKRRKRSLGDSGSKSPCLWPFGMQPLHLSPDLLDRPVTIFLKHTETRNVWHCQCDVYNFVEGRGVIKLIHFFF